MSAVVYNKNAYRDVLALTGALFLSYLAVAMALPAVPVFVVEGLHRSNAEGGLAVGVAFFATILTRAQTGAWADRVGGKSCMRRGLLVYAGAGLVCLISGLPQTPAGLAFPLLTLGRLALGLGESLAVVGMISWAVGLLSPARSGQVMSLVGIGMYGAFAAGGPLGLAALNRLGFPGLMLISTLLPLAGLIAIAPIPAVAPHPGPRESAWTILGRIWRGGAAVCLQGVGFAALGAFFSLYAMSRGWPYPGLGLTCFGVGFVAVRLLCGHLPDRIGGTPVAVASLCIEAAGQYLLWLAPGPVAAFAGAALTGIGCSMVFPALGSEVVKRTPPQLRGVAIGGFAAFQDLAYGATGPVVGGFADRLGYPAVFLIGGFAATIGIGMALAAGRSR